MAIVIACTDMRGIETIERLEATLDKPDVSSNEAMLFDALQAIGIQTAEVNCGRMIREHRAAWVLPRQTKHFRISVNPQRMLGQVQPRH